MHTHNIALDDALIRQITDRLLTAKSRQQHVHAAKELFAELYEMEGCPLAMVLARGLGRYIVNEEDLRFQVPGLERE